MTNSIKAVIFDVFGTVVDWRTSVSNHLAPALAAKSIDIDPLELAVFWRGRYDPAMNKIRTGERGYIALDQIHLENLKQTLEHFELDQLFNEDEKAQMNKAWEHLNPWPDSVDGLTALKSQTIIAPCSNGSIALMTRLSKFGKLPWDCILGADIAQNYKPHPDVYGACCKALRLNPQEVMMAACHNNDLKAARACGLATAFVPRPTEHGPNQTTDLSAEQDWDIVADDFRDLAAKFKNLN